METYIQIFNLAVEFARSKLKAFDGGHDWHHTERVLHLARHICRAEGRGDLQVVELAAVLHDIADTKFHDGSESDGGEMAFRFLAEQGFPEEKATHVKDIINNLSFKKTFDGNSASSGTGEGEAQDPQGQHVPPESFELFIVRDADRLDAMGAIGIARAFNYGGFKNRPLYDPSVPPQEYTSTEAYKKSTAPTLNHFHEKLFRLRDLMHTKTGKKLARERHDYMKGFVERFLDEWSCLR